jgi:hypothetical protein
MMAIYQLDKILHYVTHEKFLLNAVGCHLEALERRRAQRPIRLLSMMQRPLPALWFDKLTMTAPPMSFFLQISMRFYRSG